MRVRVASAGTGKTTSLVRRYLELVDEGWPLRRVAGVTFTRAAADELRQRVGAGIRQVLDGGSYLGGLFTPAGGPLPFQRARLELDGAVLSTIHGFMVAALRLTAPVVGLDPEFSVLGEWEAAAMFEEEVRSLRLLAREPGHPLREAAEALGEDAGPLLLALFGKRSLTERLVAGPAPRDRALLTLFEAAYGRLTTRFGAALLAPGEIERRALRLLDAPRARTRIVSRFPVVLVDEFQDVNPLQGSFFERLEAAGVLVEVVGDPKQSIYGFRNADVRVFRRALDAAEAGGDVLEPLTHTRRHARAVAAFLNRLTDGLAERNLGFGPREAPTVSPAGPQAEVPGAVELHWVAGERPIGELRAEEGRVLAAALSRLQREEGVPFDAMAVMGRAYGALAAAERALRAAGVPCVMLQGRGYYDRSEIRDLYHALRVGVTPEGPSLGAFLRGPFAQLRLAEVDAVLRAPDPLAALATARPEVHARLDALASIARRAPVEAVKALVRDRLVDGRRYVEFLDARARENVDALLFEVAASPPGDLEVLLDRLELLSRQADAGDVPQSGEGVRLLTVHRAKGLEFEVAAVFDAGRMLAARSDPLYLGRRDGRPVVAGSPGYPEARADALAREEQESYRLLYVALSRARDRLVVTGSVKNDRPEGWAGALSALGLGPGGGTRDEHGVAVRVYPAGGVAAASGTAPPRERPAPPPSAWVDRRFAAGRYPPVYSPSRLVRDASAEPRPASDPSDPESIPGRAAAVGTLVHYAISQDWHPDDAATEPNLAAQEVMFPFSLEERAEVLGEVHGLLSGYWRLLGTVLPPTALRQRDRAELAVTVPHGGTVWQGVIDRLYRTDEGWVVEDYKTDRRVRPERYHFQLALYVHAVERALGERPRAQLVFLREGAVVPVADRALRLAFEAGAGAA